MELDRFRKAQAMYYNIALNEIKNGQKESHWMWFIFPQIEGLGYSAKAQYYAIHGMEEAESYWKDPVLSSHLLEISKALLQLDRKIEEILGFPDNLKLKSSMTLFYAVSKEAVFKQVIDQFFDGEFDAFTLEYTDRCLV